MRLSDAGLRCRQTKLIYPNHRLPPWLTEDSTPRSLEPIVGRILCATAVLSQRSSFRTTNFRADHTSETAQTFTSTKPSGNATSRIMSSVTSVGTFEDFFGHEIH